MNIGLLVHENNLAMTTFLRRIYRFFCAVERDMRLAWAQRIHDILKPGGELITLMFPVITLICSFFPFSSLFVQLLNSHALKILESFHFAYWSSDIENFKTDLCQYFLMAQLKTKSLCGGRSVIMLMDPLTKYQFQSNYLPSHFCPPITRFSVPLSIDITDGTFVEILICL